MSRSPAFHAAPPPGQWLNDPNALFRDGDGAVLLAQHRADPPDRATGWGRLSSPDLLAWRWRGEALPPAAHGWAYSGSAVRTPAGVELFHTAHDEARPLQRQRRRTLDGRDLPLAGTPVGANVRDPYVFAHGGGWRMLLARPCDWHRWRDDPPSELALLASDDRIAWQSVGRIGPWSPPGVMWEVPLIVAVGGRHLLIVSMVDRRMDAALCSVRGWVGRFDGAGFAPDPGQPGEGQPLDLGPDFYALIAGVDDDWPDAERPFVAWLASWATASRRVWPDVAGGPISLPRRIGLGPDRRTITNRPVALPADAFAAVDARPVAGRATASAGGAFALVVDGPAARLAVTVDAAGTIAVDREGGAPFAWAARHERLLAPAAARSLALYVDGPAIELFVEPDGRSVSAVLPGGVNDVRLAGCALAWEIYRPA